MSSWPTGALASSISPGPTGPRELCPRRGSVVLASRLAEAFLNVPRHSLVPVFYRCEGERFVPWRIGDGDAEAWIDAVYEDDSLITEVDEIGRAHV